MQNTKKNAPLTDFHCYLIVPMIITLTRRSAFFSMIILVYVMSIAYLPVKISDVKLD
jgi:peptidoglycan/LPS O-acetylase OafA/YrhL